MSQKTQKPTLTGQRIKTRKRDEKEKYDPSNFRDLIVTGLNEVNTDIEKASKFLIQTGSKLDYRRYAEALFDVLITGGILAPGGTVVVDNATIAELCIFNTDEDVNSMRNITQMFERITRQYKYLEKSLDDEMKKVLMFMKGFTDLQRTRLVTATYLMITSGLITPSCLNQILNEHLTKDGTALEFACKLFSLWIEEKDINSLVSYLKKAEIDGRLIDLFPAHRQTLEFFNTHFENAGLEAIVRYQKNLQARHATKDLKARLKSMFSDDDESDVIEVIAVVKEFAEKQDLKDAELCLLVWTSMMTSIEWSKKDDLLDQQAIARIRKYSQALQIFATNPKIELALLQKVQEYCYDNIDFVPLFQKIVMLLYKTDVISEDTIIIWYKSGHVAKGKNVFLAQMEKMIKWLMSAEEESSEEDEEDDDDE
jgi:hypothetical protein